MARLVAILKWRMCKLGLKKRQFKNSAIFKVSFKKAVVNLKLAQYSKVRFKKFKNGACPPY